MGQVWSWGTDGWRLTKKGAVKLWENRAELCAGSVLAGGDAVAWITPSVETEHWCMESWVGTGDSTAAHAVQPLRSRQNAAVTVFGASLWVACGLSDRHGWLQDVVEVHVPSGKATVHPPLSEAPSPRDKTAYAVVLNRYLLIVGGFGPDPEAAEEEGESSQRKKARLDSSSSSEEEDSSEEPYRGPSVSFRWMADAFAWDMESRVWVQVLQKGAPPGPRAAASMCAVEGSRVVLFGGRCSASQKLMDVYVGQISVSGEGLTLEWTAWAPTVGRAPCARSFAAMAPLDADRVLVSGGVDMSDRRVLDAHVLHISKHAWAELSVAEPLREISGDSDVHVLSAVPETTQGSSAVLLLGLSSGLSWVRLEVDESPPLPAPTPASKAT